VLLFNCASSSRYREQLPLGSTLPFLLRGPKPDRDSNAPYAGGKLAEMITSDRQGGIVHSILDGSGQTCCCWLLTDDEDQYKEGRRQAQLALNAAQEVRGSIGFIYYYVGARCSNGDGLFYQIKEAVEAEAKRMNQEVSQRFKRMSAAERRKWNQDWQEKNRARVGSQHREAFSAAEWKWPNAELVATYQAGCELALDVSATDWRERLNADLLSKLVSHETQVAVQYAILDAKADELRAQAQRFRPLVAEMERQEIDHREEWRIYVGARIAISRLMQTLETSASNTICVFQARRRRIPSAVERQVRQRDNDRCIACGGNVELEMDHILPFRVGGWHAPENLRLLCGVCHKTRDHVEYDLQVDWHKARILTLADAIAYDAPVIAEIARCRTDMTFQC
jgi:HNH endonuclease